MRFVPTPTTFTIRSNVYDIRWSLITPTKEFGFARSALADFLRHQHNRHYISPREKL